MAIVSIGTITSSANIKNYTILNKKRIEENSLNIINNDYVISNKKNISAIELNQNINILSLKIKKNIIPNFIYCNMRNILYFDSGYCDISYSEKILFQKKVKKHLNFAQANFRINGFAYKNHNKEPEVIKINDIELTYPLIYSKNFDEEKYISNSILAIDGSSIVNVIKKAKFSSKYTLVGEYIHKDIINQLFSSISKNIITLEFTNGNFIEAKYNLLENPIVAKDVFEGSEYFNIKIKVLV